MILLSIMPIGLNLRSDFCPGGGTGRRAGFKIQFWQQSEGSIPSPGTKQCEFESEHTYTVSQNARSNTHFYCSI